MRTRIADAGGSMTSFAFLFPAFTRYRARVVSAMDPAG
jgi:hypothetical protein